MTQINLLDFNKSEEGRAHAANLLGFFNIVAKHVLKEEKYEQVGRFPKFFHANDKRDVHNVVPSIQAWPGYEVISRLSVQGIFMSADCCTKFVRKDTILDEYRAARRNGVRDAEFFEQFNSSNTSLVRVTVITSYNSKSYQVDGMTKEYTPATYEFMRKDRKTKEEYKQRMDQYFW